jgi:hypothetical protein
MLKREFKGIRTKNGANTMDLLLTCYFLQRFNQELLHSVMLYQSNDVKEANASTGMWLSRKIY